MCLFSGGGGGWVIDNELLGNNRMLFELESRLSADGFGVTERDGPAKPVGVDACELVNDLGLAAGVGTADAVSSPSTDGAPARTS